jgi:tryptophan synthase alpha chain
MGYFNPILSYGIDKFCRDCNRAGVDGLIVPDLPPEEGTAVEDAAARDGVDVIYLLSPNSTDERIRLVAEKSRGFIYLVSVTGVTGVRQTTPSGLGEFIKRVRKHARQPLCVGFGVSSAQQARQIASLADGIIIGSRLIQLMKSDPSLAALRGFVTGVRQALD